jgi:hypothetical protein
MSAMKNLQEQVKIILIYVSSSPFSGKSSPNLARMLRVDLPLFLAQNLQRVFSIQQENRYGIRR